MTKQAIREEDFDENGNCTGWVLVALPDDFKDGDPLPAPAATDQRFRSEHEAARAMAGEQQRLVQCGACGGALQVHCAASEPHTTEEFYTLECEWCHAPVIRALPGEILEVTKAVFDPDLS